MNRIALLLLLMVAFQIVNHGNAVAITEDKRLNVEGAKAACRSLGSNWKVTRTTEGSLVCSTVPWSKNCNKCDSWRLLVWNDGACEISKHDAYSKCVSAATKAGHYYCGYKPCKGGDLNHAGTWAVGHIFTGDQQGENNGDVMLGDQPPEDRRNQGNLVKGKCTFVLGIARGGTDKRMGSTDTDDECADLVRRTEPKANAARRGSIVCYAHFAVRDIDVSGRHNEHQWRTCLFTDQ